MPIVNYVREHRRFIKYASDEKLTASEKLLWYVLMELFNQEAEGNVWPDDFIRISNIRVLSLLEPMGEDTMFRARNALKQHGRIDFRPGNKNKLNPAYRMIYFYPECYPQNTGNVRGNIGGNIQDNTGGNTRDNIPDNTGDIYINQNKGYTKTKNDFEEEDEEKQESYARAREEAETAWIENFGVRPTPAILHRIANAQAQCWTFCDGVIAMGIEQAALHGTGNPIKYLMKTLADWKEHKVFTVEDADEYSFLFRASNGGAEDILNPSEACDRIRAFRQDRETDEEQEARIRHETELDEVRRQHAELISRHQKERETKQEAKG